MRRTLPFVLLSLGLFPGCETFDPPPKPSVVGLDNGIMSTEPDAPFVIHFSEPIVKSSLQTKLVPYVKDAEGNLLDEQSPPDLQKFAATTLVAFNGAAPADQEGVSFNLDAQSLTITRDERFDVSAGYLALFEPGLEDLDGNKTVPRVRIPFTFQLPGGGPTQMPTGYYYFLINVDYLATQIQAFTYMEVNPETGVWKAIFTNGNRLEALNTRPGCPSGCSGLTTICALLPSPHCVKPSEKQTALEQFVDFLPDKAPPNGYTFIANGVVRDEPNGTTAFGTAPFLIEVTIGSGGILVQAEDTKISGVFRLHDDNRWRGTGTANVKVVKLNGVGKDPTEGTFEAMSLTADEVKAVEAFGYEIPTLPKP